MMKRNASESPNAHEAAKKQRLQTVEAENESDTTEHQLAESIDNARVEGDRAQLMVDDSGVDVEMGDEESESEEEDDDNVSVYEDEDERAAVAEEKKMPDLRERDDVEEDGVDAHEEPYSEEASAIEELIKESEADNSKKEKKKRVRKERVPDIRNFKHVELGSPINQEKQKEYPVESERQADIAVFAEDW
jgi:hypothetical protein